MRARPLHRTGYRRVDDDIVTYDALRTIPVEDGGVWIECEMIGPASMAEVRAESIIRPGETYVERPARKVEIYLSPTDVTLLLKELRSAAINARAKPLAGDLDHS